VPSGGAADAAFRDPTDGAAARARNPIRRR
jgi:hypothetical protein